MKKFIFLLLALLPLAGAGQTEGWSNDWLNEWSVDWSKIKDVGMNTPNAATNYYDEYWAGYYIGRNGLMDPMSILMVPMDERFEETLILDAMTGGNYEEYCLYLFGEDYYTYEEFYDLVTLFIIYELFNDNSVTFSQGEIRRMRHLQKNLCAKHNIAYNKLKYRGQKQ